MSLTLSTLAAVWAGAFLGGLAAGGAGFAFALVASAIWLHVFDPAHTTALIVASGMVLQIVLVWPIHRLIHPPTLAPYLLAAVPGVLIGAAILTRGGAGPVRTVLGVFLLAYGVYALAAPRLHHVRDYGRPADAAIGFAGGVLGGLAGYSGVLPIIWTQMRGLPKDEVRGICQPFILVVHVLTLICVGATGMDGGTMLMLLAALPALAVGAWLGWRIYGRLDERRFRQALAALIAVSGLTLVL